VKYSGKCEDFAKVSVDATDNQLEEMASGGHQQPAGTTMGA